jgi:hypothetical protein
MKNSSLTLFSEKWNWDKFKNMLRASSSILTGIALIFILSLTINSCKKDVKTSYSIRMTDAPGPYTEVNIDLQSVEVTGNGGKSMMLSITPGIVNLLDFSNGLDTLIATGELDYGSVEQIRLVLGANNTVVVNSVTYPLSTPSADQSGLKLQVHQVLTAGVAYNVLLDFDANKSIVSTGNGQYKLKPVIRTVEIALSGSIKGNILPLGTSVTVEATSNGISYSTAVNELGRFLIQGLPAGTYSVTLTPASPLNPFTFDNVEVTTGINTDIGITQF